MSTTGMSNGRVEFDAMRVCREVPSCLRELRQWICWRFIVRGGKTTKCPMRFNGSVASATDPKTWGSFDDAVAACKKRTGLAGVGFVFSANDLFTGVDLDNCIDGGSGVVKAWARLILNQLDSYSEISPSGKGVKIFVRASKTGDRCKIGYQDGAVEMYDRGRFFTTTGMRLPDCPANVEARQVAIDALYVSVFGDQHPLPVPLVSPSNNGSAPLDDDEIIRLASSSRTSGGKFAALWAGRWDGHFKSASEADSSVAFTLAFYTKSAEQLDRLYRRSGLMREKWDKRRGQHTYGETTIARALTKVTDQYQSRKRRAKATEPTGAIAGKSLSGEPQPGTIDRGTGRLILSKDRTLPTAETYINQFCRHAEGVTLRHYAGLFMKWRDNRYVESEDAALQHHLLPWLHAAVRMVNDGQNAGWVAQDFPANPHTVKAALESIKGYTYLRATTASPSWLDRRDDRPNPSELLPCKSALLHLPTMKLLAPTPAFFSVSALDYDHDPAAPEPTQWQAFLSLLFEDDLACWDLLQEWFGYCLSGDTSQHKMLLIVGPRRSGKGTIARVLTRLVGPANVCAPTTSSLAGLFGLQPLIGKSLAIVSDARFSGKDVQIVVERLLCISGEDSLTIDRKHMTSVTMKLPTRFVFLTNELPRLTDASGALSGRVMMLRLTESFYGREDRTLTNKLLAELPGILNWSIEGWRQLRARGHFVQPASVEDALRDMEDLASPVAAFMRERCDIGPGLRVWVDDLYLAWKNWCEADGRGKASTKQTFGRDLMAAVPGISTRVSTAARFYQGIALKRVSG